jgi:hypothetical protein
MRLPDAVTETAAVNGYTGPMPRVPVPEVPLGWLIEIINEYGTRPRSVAGESDDPYPDPSHARPPSIPQLSVKELIGLADQLWPIFGADTLTERTAALDALLTTARLTPSITDEAQLQWRTNHTAAAKLVAAGSATALLTVVHSDGWHRLGVCAGTDCVDVHLDRYRRPRRYCSTTCLNRARIRAYRARQHGQDRLR